MLPRFLSRGHYFPCEFNAAGIVYACDKRLHFKATVRVMRVVWIICHFWFGFVFGLWVYLISSGCTAVFHRKKSRGKKEGQMVED